MSGEIFKVRPGALKHGTYECYVAGCEKRACKSAYYARIEARKSFSYYQPPKAITRPRNVSRHRKVA